MRSRSSSAHCQHDLGVVDRSSRAHCRHGVKTTTGTAGGARRAGTAGGARRAGTTGEVERALHGLDGRAGDCGRESGGAGCW
jgi:hypothetical protein